jgi:peptidoglycan/xylan/chitin deacetylase (PgdA/CDA1 family)
VTEGPERRRAGRLGRRRQLRRRRLAAVAALGLVVAALAFGLVRAFGGGGRAARPEAQATQSTATGPQKRTENHSSKPSPSGLGAQARKALDRFVRLGLPLYCGGRKGRYVALTFDDGPGPYTERYAFRIFRQTKTRVTWFLVGRLLSGWPSVPRRELAFGSVGDHTWTHPYLPRLTESEMKQELASTQRAIERATGRSVQLFRPPYGARNAAIDAESHRLGMLEVLWSIDSLDSQGADYLGITREVLDNLRSGSIILFHENRGQTIRALKYHILPALKKRRFKTVSIPELLALDPPTRKQLAAGPRGC